MYLQYLRSFHCPATVVTYDPVTRDWAELVTGGQVPAPTAGAASAASSEGTLYVYGGVARGDTHGFWLVDTSNLLYSLGPHPPHPPSSHYPLYVQMWRGASGGS